MNELEDFMKDPWKRINEMRNTPHECDYDYRIDPSGKMFFQICKLCFDTSGVVEMGKDYVPKCAHTWYMRELGIQCTKCMEVWDENTDLS